MKKLPYFIQVVIASLFIAAAISKMFFLPAVGREIEAYQLVPDSMVVAGAMVLVASEFILGVWLLSNKKTKWAALFAVGLLSVFIVAKASAVIRGIEIDCDVCFGTLLSLPLWANLILNVSMIAVLLFVMKRNVLTKSSIIKVYGRDGDAKGKRV